MELLFPRALALRSLKRLSGVVERRNQLEMPLLSGILLKAEGNTLSFMATDKELELITQEQSTDQTPFVIQEAGEIVLPFRKFYDIVRALPEDKTIKLKGSSDQVTLQVDRSRFKLTALSTEGFPKSDLLSEEKGVVLEGKALEKLLEKTAFAMAEQDVRFYLNGMLWEVFPGKLQTVASDGHRLAMSEMALTASDLTAFRVIVPRKTILELLKLLGETRTDRVQILFSESKIQFIMDKIILTSRLIDGQFPSFEQILPKSGDKILKADKQQLKAAFLRAAAIFSEQYGINLAFSDDLLKITGQDQGKHQVEETLQVQYQGDSAEIAFNVKYLIDFLNAIETQDICLTFSNPNESALVEGVQAQETARYVIMPMSL